MISRDLEVALHESFMRARERRHKWITVEHLLLQLVDVPLVQERLRSGGIDAVAFRADLEGYVSQTETFPSSEEGDTEPTAAFQKAIQYAILMVQERGRDEVAPIDILEVVVARSERLKLNPLVQRRIASMK